MRPSSKQKDVIFQGFEITGIDEMNVELDPDDPFIDLDKGLKKFFVQTYA